jgi:hypothetical protein
MYEYSTMRVVIKTFRFLTSYYQWLVQLKYYSKNVGFVKICVCLQSTIADKRWKYKICVNFATSRHLVQCFVKNFAEYQKWNENEQFSRKTLKRSKEKL